MSVLPQSQRHRAQPLDTDPLRYLRGVLGFFLGGGAVVALLLALTGVAPKALLLAGLLWGLFGMLASIVDVVFEPLAELAGGLLAGVGVKRAPPDRLADVLRRVEQLSDAEPALAAAELEGFRRDAGLLLAADEIRLGVALAALYDRRLDQPGRALGELRHLIDRHPHLRETVQLRARLAELQDRHPGGRTP